MDRLLQDLRFAMRLLSKDRSFSLTTVATLALCLAANVAIFAVVNGVLLKPLPFPEPERLIRLFNQYPGAGVDTGGSNGVPDYFDRKRDMPALEETALFRSSGVTISGNGLSEAERIQGMQVTPSFFRVLRTQPLRGQLFSEEQGELGQEKVVVLTHGLWQRLFAGQDDAIGKDVRLGGTPYKVVGVLPREFVFLDPDVQIFRPAAFTAREKSDESRHSNNWQQIGRLKPSATVQQAQAQLDAINAANNERFPQWREILKNARFRSVAVNFQQDLIGNRRSTLQMLWGGAIFVLLIGCVNVANLVLVRSTSRIRELATRHAMGATFGRLARQALTESTVLAIVGGFTGLALGWWALRAAPFFGFDRLPSGQTLSLDPGVGAFTALLIFAVGLGIGLIPVIAMRRANMAQVIREEGRSGTQGRGPKLMRRILVTSQVAFALMLLIGAGVLLASFDRVLTIDPGFRVDHVLTGAINMPATRYPDDKDLHSVTTRILERVRAIPGVQQAGLTTTIPFAGSYSDSVIFAEGYQMQKGESLISPGQVVASDGYFEAMGAKLVSGRLFTADDVAGRQKVLIVDTRLAQKFWPGASPLGKRMYFPQDVRDIFAKPKEEDMLTIVGVIEPMRLRGLVDGPGQITGAYYSPLAQNPSRSLGLAIRTTQDPETVTAVVRREINGIDPEMPFYSVKTMEDRMSESLLDRRTPMLLATGFAAVALFLAAIGIYGVLAYQVSQRRREIGIRMALGAGANSIFNLVLVEGGVIVGLGAVFGLAGAFLLRQTMQAQLYETGAMDPRIVGAVAGMLIVVALGACVLPARRAAKTDPLIALSD